MSQDEKNVWPDNNPENGTNIERLFRMFADGAMSPKPYKKQDLPQSVTAYLSPENMEILHVIACRLGASRGNIAAHILKCGLLEAAAGCGFDLECPEGSSDCFIPEEQKNTWNTTPRKGGFSFVPSEDEA